MGLDHTNRCVSIVVKGAKFNVGKAVQSIPIAILLLSIASAHPVSAVTTITAYKAQTPVNLSSPYQQSEWTDTPQFFEKASEMTVAFKQNGTGLLFLMQWTESSFCTDTACFGGIELGHMNNTAEMGTPITPTIMILASPSFKGDVDEFISTGDQTPTSVESYGYITQSVCNLALAGQQYTAECYRPFALHNASPYDFNLGVGSTVEIAFAVGEFTSPGDHLASDMITYVLTITNQTYTATSTTSATSTSESSSGSSSGTQSTTSLSSSTTPTPSSSTTLTSSSSSAVSAVTAAPNPTIYAEELAVIVVGFSALILVVLTKYRSR